MSVCVTLSLTSVTSLRSPSSTAHTRHRKWAQLWSPRLDGKHYHTEIENFAKPKHCTENVTWIVFGGLHWLFLSAERVRMYELCQIKAVLIVWCCGDSVTVKCDDLWQQQPAGVSISVAGTGVHCDGCPAPLAHHWYTDLALALCPTQHCSHCCASFHLMWNIQMKPTGCNEYINISTQLHTLHTSWLFGVGNNYANIRH